MDKKKIIEKIKTIIDDYGSFSTGEICAESSPCVNSKGSLTSLAERFVEDEVTVIVYDRKGNEVDEYNTRYDSLKREVLEEILELAEEYKKTQE